MLAGGASAFADANELELEHSRREQELTQRKFAYLWRDQDIAHRKRIMQWKQIDFKRRMVDSKSKEVTLLAELAALVAGFQMIMFYENQLADVGTYLFSQALLTVHGILCLFVSCVNIFVMVFASIINFQVIIVIPSGAAMQTLLANCKLLFPRRCCAVCGIR